MSRLTRLLQRLTLTEVAPDTFAGGAGAGGIGSASRLFGGLVAAQAYVAAQNTVDHAAIHSLHAYFLRPGRALNTIVYRVERSKEGRNFKSRQVTGWQDGECIFQLLASFQRPARGVEHHAPAPAVPAPDTLPNRDQLRGREDWESMPIDVRMATPITADRALPPEQHIWLRANGELPTDQVLHNALVVYASDRTLLDTAWRPHADTGALAGASLDHSMWFHEAPRFNDWILYTMQSPAAAGGRGLAIGAMYGHDGRRLVTTAQEGVLRAG